MNIRININKMILTKSERNKFNKLYQKMFEKLDYKPGNYDVYGSFVWEAPLPTTSGDVDSIEYVKLEDFDDWFKTTYLPLVKTLKKGDLLMFHKLHINDFKTKSVNNIPTSKQKIYDLVKDTDKLKDWVKFELQFIDDDGLIKDISVIYSFNKNKISNKENEELLLEDILDLEKEGNYYKMLKRLYVLADMMKQKKLKEKIKNILIQPQLSGIYTIINTLKAMEISKGLDLKKMSQTIIEKLRKIGIGNKTTHKQLSNPTKHNIDLIIKTLNRKMKQIMEKLIK